MRSCQLIKCSNEVPFFDISTKVRIIEQPRFKILCFLLIFSSTVSMISSVNFRLFKSLSVSTSGKLNSFLTENVVSLSRGLR